MVVGMLFGVELDCTRRTAALQCIDNHHSQRHLPRNSMLLVGTQCQAL